ncbi:MAG: RelA/SpoT domain-containing protein [Dysgonamonadaceae bacterium]|jgi:ppGpp synthetase/RelA/SpoT-type nucleotidyltranferase|nr:RelA/SpoT domain-containing protein [Dysgonamonadaceae bacterium]
MIDIQSICNKWTKEEPNYKELGRIVVDFLKDKLTKFEMLPEITCRTKELFSIIKKIKKKQKDKEKTYSFESLTDKLGVRIICPFLSDLDIVDTFITENFQVHKIEKKKDKIDFDKLDYQSNHYDVSIKYSISEFAAFSQFQNMIFEIQVRTLNQHTWANSAHILFYKQDIDMPDDVKRKIYRLLSIYEIADEEFALVNKYLQEQPDNFLYTILRKLEGKIYKYAKIDFDRELSVENIRTLCSFLTTNEQNSINQNIEKFILENNDKIEHIFNEYKSRFYEIPFLTQPEVFIIWFGLENFEFSIKDNWSIYFDEFELEQIQSIWGCQIN